MNVKTGTTLWRWIMSVSDIGWCMLALFDIIGLAFLCILAIIVTSPIWIPYYLLIRFLEWYGGETMEELDRIIAEKHRCSVERIPYVGV